MGKVNKCTTDLFCLAMGKEECTTDLLCPAMGKEKKRRSATLTCSA